MWMLMVTLCAEVGRYDAACHYERQGPYYSSEQCRERLVDMEQALEALAADVGADLLFLNAFCQKGDDA